MTSNLGDKKLGNLDLLGNKKKQKYISLGEKFELDYDNIIEVFEGVVGKYEDRIALVQEDQHITYSELNRRSNVIARYLKSVGIKE